MTIFWSSKGDRVKRLLVRRCSHSAQQRQREQLNAGLAVGHPKYPLECTLPSYRFHHVEARSCTRAKPELAAAVLTHLRRFVKPSLGGKAFKSEPPVVFFPLDPKKRHLHWATWSILGSSETGGLSEDPKNLKTLYRSSSQRAEGWESSFNGDTGIHTGLEWQRRMRR